MRCILVITLFVLVGCGGGSSSDSPDTPAPAPNNDTSPPTASVVFPVQNALATTSKLTVSGYAEDESAIRAVSVNGNAASSVDGYRTWQAVIDIAPGSNALSVRVEDEHGNIDAAAVERQFEGGFVFSSATSAIAWSATAEKGYISDYTSGTIVEVDPASGHYTPWFGPNSAAVGPAHIFASIAVDDSTEKLYAMTGDYNALLEIDINNRSWQAISLENNKPVELQSNKLLAPLQQLLVNAATAQLYVRSRAGIYIFNLNDSSWDQAVFTSPDTDDMYLDGANQRLIVSGETGIAAIDVSNGNRNTFSVQGTPAPRNQLLAGPVSTNTSMGLAYDSNAYTLWRHVVDGNTINQQTLPLSEFFNPREVRDLVYSASDNSALILSAPPKEFSGDSDSSQLQLHRYQIDSGESSLVVSGADAQDIPFHAANAIYDAHYHEQRREHITVGSNAVIISDQNAERRRLPGLYEDGHFTHFSVLDAAANRLLYFQQASAAINAYDLNDGQKSEAFNLQDTLAAHTTPAVANEYYLQALSLDSQNNRLLLLLRNKILSMSLESGEISAYIDLSNNPATLLTGLAINSDNNRLYFFDSGNNTLQRADLDSGANISTAATAPAGSPAQLEGMPFYHAASDSLLVTTVAAIYRVDLNAGALLAISDTQRDRRQFASFNSLLLGIGDSVYLQGKKGLLYQLETSSGDVVFITQ